MLILFFDTMWGEPLDVGPGIAGVEFTTDRQRYDEADAVVFHLPEWPSRRTAALFAEDWTLCPKKRSGQLWVGWSMECDVHYPHQCDPAFMRHFDLSMTYHPASDIPVTYVEPFGPAEKMMQAFRRPPQLKTEPAPVVSFISSGHDRSGRFDYLRELAQYVAIDSYGKFMRNRSLPSDTGRQTKLDIVAGYKFTIAFENARAADYVTEKFFDPLWAGSVPIYLGAPNVADFAPGAGCFINAADYPEPRMLGDYLLELCADECKYNAFFEWKKNPFHAAFQSLLAINGEGHLQRLAQRAKARLLCH